MDDIEPGEITAIPPRVARKQRDPGNRRVRADKEIRQYSGLRTAPAAILPEDHSCQEQRFARDGLHPESAGAQHRLELFDAQVGDRELCIDHGINEEGVLQRRCVEPGLRPICPVGVVLDDIEDDVRVDKEQSIPARERHDFLSGHPDGCGATQCRKPAAFSRRRLARFSLRQYRTAIPGGLESHRRAGLDAEMIPHLLRDGYLSLAGYQSIHGHTSKYYLRRDGITSDVASQAPTHPAPTHPGEGFNSPSGCLPLAQLLRPVAAVRVADHFAMGGMRHGRADRQSGFDLSPEAPPNPLGGTNEPQRDLIDLYPLMVEPSHCIEYFARRLSVYALV
jgi:hypothetical protein